MEPSPVYSNLESIGNESGEETHSSCEDEKLNGGLVIRGKEDVENKVPIPSVIQGIEYFTTEIVGDINEDYFSEEMLDIRYFISGRFFLDKNDCCYRSYVDEDYIFTLEHAGRDKWLWVGVYEGVEEWTLLLRALSCNTSCLFDELSSWEVLEQPGACPVKLRFIPRKLTVGCLVETITSEVHAVQAIHSEEVLLRKGKVKNIISSGLRRDKLNKTTFFAP